MRRVMILDEVRLFMNIKNIKYIGNLILCSAISLAPLSASGDAMDSKILNSAVRQGHVEFQSHPVAVLHAANVAITGTKSSAPTLDRSNPEAMKSDSTAETLVAAASHLDSRKSESSSAPSRLASNSSSTTYISPKAPTKTDTRAPASNLKKPSATSPKKPATSAMPTSPRRT